ncbi:hypothetical protein D3C72_1714030 [compost metagenome]
MDVEFAEALGKGLLFQRRDVLIPEEQHFMLEPERLDLREQFGVLAGIDQADVADLGPEGRRHALDLQGVLEHRRPDDGRGGRRGAGYVCFCHQCLLVMSIGH